MKVYKGEPGKPVVVFEGTGKPKPLAPLAPKAAKLGFAWGKPTVESIAAKLVQQRADAGQPEAAVRLMREQINQEAIELYKRAFGASRHLALVILLDALGDEKEVQKYYMRFKQRMLDPLDAGAAWSFSSLEVVACITEIKADYESMRVPMRMAQQEPTPVVSEFGADVVWHKDRAR